MLKPELIAQIADHADIPRYLAAQVLTALTDEITEVLAAGESVILAGLGSFVVKAVPERRVRNPRSGELQTVAAHRRVVFRPAKRLKDAAQGA
ncbi:MAG: HU family DNA-binding protein [Hahellaceae bacterium]|jgi:nucleoid DNA-binding protein|nr:HU family DNA-binding protein [Hahellaceae bacterium]